MIYPATYYEAKCDHCGLQWDDDGMLAYKEKEGMQDTLMDSEWMVSDSGETYCPDCYSFADEDDFEIVLKPERKNCNVPTT